MKRNHILSHKNDKMSYIQNINSIEMPPIHPKYVQKYQEIKRHQPQNEQHLYQIERDKYSYFNSNLINQSQSLHGTSKGILKNSPNLKEYQINNNNQHNWKSNQIYSPPRMDIIANSITSIDKVRSSNKGMGNVSSKIVTRQIVEEQVYQYSPTFDYDMAEQQMNMQIGNSGWAAPNQQQFFQEQPAINPFQNEGKPPNLGESTPMNMMFSQMIAQGANNQPNFQSQMLNQSNGIPLPGMGDIFNQAPQNLFMLPSGSNDNWNMNMNMNMNNINMAQDMMPVPLPFQQNFQNNNMNGGMGMSGAQMQNPMMMSGTEMNNSLIFSQASAPGVPFNFNQGPNPNLFQSNAIPPSGLAQQFSQQFQAPPFQNSQMNEPSVTNNLAAGFSNLFQPQNQPLNPMNFSRTQPLNQFNNSNNLQASAADVNFASSLNQLINQGQQQVMQEQNYSYHPQHQAELITCVICKETYDVNNTRDHVLKHKSFRLSSKNELLQTALAGTTQRPKLIIPKRPTIKPIVQPEECVMKPQGNTYVFQKIHRLQGQQLQIVDDFVNPIADTHMSQDYRSSVSNRMAPLIPGTDTPDPNYFPNSYQPDLYNDMHPYQEQNQPVYGMMSSHMPMGNNMGGSQIRNSQIRNSQIRNSQIRNSMMGNSLIRNSQMPGSSEVSDFSYNYLGDQIPQPPQTGVIASQMMKVPRQVLAAWRG